MNLNMTLIGQTIAFLFVVLFTMKAIWPMIISAMRERQEAIAAGLRASEEADQKLALASSSAEEEMVKANDLGNYYSIASDNRDLNYAPYFSEGNKNEVPSGEYNSDNTERLDVAKMKDLLMQLPEIKNDPLIKL